MEKFIGAILLKDYVKFIEHKLPKLPNASLVKILVPHEQEHEIEFKYSGHDFFLFHMPAAEDFWFYLDRVYVDCKEAYDMAKNMGIKNIDYDFEILAEVKAAQPIIDNKFEESIIIKPKAEERLPIDAPKKEEIKKEEPKKEEIKSKRGKK